MDSSQPNFDFIMNPSRGSRGAGFAAGSKKQRIIIFVGGVLLLLVVTIVIGSIISANTGKASKAVVDLAAYQTELQRVISLGSDKARDSNLHNKSLTASYTLLSDYQLTIKMMSARGIKPPKDLATKYAGKQTDQLLDTADKSNTFDVKYDEIYKEKLTKYKAKLAEVYPQLNPNEKVIVKLQSDHVKILLGEPVVSTTLKK
jgi:hypothetical protein